MTSQFATREIFSENLDELAALARASISAEENATFYRWKYFDNPAGQALGRCAFDEEKLLGLNVAIPVEFQTGPDAHLAMQQVDAMVLPEMRRRGILTVLLDETFERMDEAGIALGFGFPAAITLKTVTSKFGWTHLLNIPRFVRVIDVAQATIGVDDPARRFLYGLWLKAVQLYARSRMKRADTPGIQVEPINDYDERFDDLWSRASCNLKLAMDRTSTYLRWRYAAHPERTYRCLGALVAGRLDAYAIFGQVETQGSQTWELVELIIDPSTRAAGLALLDGLCSRAKEEGITQLTIWALPHQRLYTGLLAEAGFVHAESRLFPRRFRYTTPFVVRSHPKIELPVSPFEAGNWFLSMGDSDLH